MTSHLIESQAATACNEVLGFIVGRRHMSQEDEDFLGEQLK